MLPHWECFCHSSPGRRRISSRHLRLWRPGRHTDQDPISFRRLVLCHHLNKKQKKQPFDVYVCSSSLDMQCATSVSAPALSTHRSSHLRTPKCPSCRQTGLSAVAAALALGVIVLCVAARAAAAPISIGRGHAPSSQLCRHLKLLSSSTCVISAATTSPTVCTTAVDVEFQRSRHTSAP